MFKLFTRRELHVLVVFFITMFALLILRVDQQTLDGVEYLGLFFFVLPIGLYIATDPERK